MSFCASRRVRQVRFFCIISWSSPVITITTKAPLRNCFQKFCLLIQSSITNMRLCSSVAIALTASVADIPSCPITLYIISIKAANMQVVWKVSVHTSVFIPPRRVYSHISATIATTVKANGTPIASSTKRCNIMHTT